jgi:DNA modification methylase
MLEHFNPSEFNGIVLDESSILKSYDGKFRTRIIEYFSKTKFRLACTATPAPNDYMELGNHAEFLGIMSRSEMLAMFFVHDGGETQKWRLKGHAQKDFWSWVCSWAVMIKKPSDLGYDDGNFKLPKLNFHEIAVDAGKAKDMLFPLPASTLQERISARRDSVEERAKALIDIIGDDKGPWIVWCNLNKESDLAEKLIENSINVQGSDSLEFKKENLIKFSKGDIRVLISKCSIAGFGMNFQVCHKMIFFGLSDSYEEFYQAVRRTWRFGQKKEVDCYVVISKQEGAVLENIKRKEKDAEKMSEEMVKNMASITRKNIKSAQKEVSIYKHKIKTGDGYKMILGDCVEQTTNLKSDSVHYSVFSPPFASLYTYSNSERDMGNCKSHSEFYAHFEFLVKELHRVIMPGRLVSFHCMNLPTSKQNHGYIGIVDFRGNLIKMFQEAGFIYHSEVCIWKDPVTAMQRTKALGLLHKQLKKDSCMSRQGIPDYLVTMRKRGDNPERVTHTNETLPVKVWQQYASPIWMDINPSNTLQFRAAREHNDERHICPLQLQVIERAIELWTNKGDTVLSPFAGIESEGYVALKKERQFIGIELKESYYKQAVKNLEFAVSEKKQAVLI